MEDSPFKLKGLVLAVVFSSIVLTVILVKSLFESQTRIVFCDVGQGDGSYIRIKNKFDILIDAGGDQKILSCLGKYMPFYDREIELAIISHPQNDHFYGFNYVLDRYQVDQFIASTISSPSQSFEALKQKIDDRKIKINLVKGDDIINVFNDTITFLWPKKENGNHNINDLSLVFIFQEKDFRVLFTGDASPLALSKLSHQSIPKVNVLKVPHHGSKNGLIAEFLRLAEPAVAVISVGKNNSYGHPSSEVLAMLEALKIQIKRTDTEGDVVFKINP